MKHTRRTWTVENKWTCTSCGKENLGRFISCQSCGNPKEQHEQQAERIDPNAVVTDAARLAEATQASHWTCPYCDGKQRDPDGNCINCGGAKRAEPTQKTSGRLPELPPRPRPPPAPAPRGRYLPPKPPPTRRAPRRDPELERFEEELAAKRFADEQRRRFLLWVGGGVGVVAFIVLLVWLFTPHELDAKVTSMKWIHMARYEERIVKHDEGWGSPGGAFNVSCHSKYYGTENCNPYQCNPHSVSYQCNPRSCNCRTTCTNSKNGYSNCSETCSTCYSTCSRTEYSTCYQQCPVYRQWCSYDYYAWVGRGERTLSGASAKTMTWPELGPIDETHRLVKTPAYIVNFADGKDTYSYAPDTAGDFERFDDGQLWLCEKRVVGMFKPLRRK